jgi:hypothetical protein
MEGERLAKHIQVANSAGSEFRNIPGTVPYYIVDYDALDRIDIDKYNAIFEMFGENGLTHFSITETEIPNRLKNTEWEQEAKKNNKIWVAIQKPDYRGKATFVSDIYFDVIDEMRRLFNVREISDIDPGNYIATAKRIAQEKIEAIKEDSPHTWQTIMEFEKSLDEANADKSA